MTNKRAPPTSDSPEMLTDSEIQSLRREAKETSAYARKAFAHLRPRFSLTADDISRGSPCPRYIAAWYARTHGKADGK